MQNKETSERTLINYEQGQRVVCAWATVKEGEVAKETETALKGSRFDTACVRAVSPREVYQRGDKEQEG